MIEITTYLNGDDYRKFALICDEAGVSASVMLAVMARKAIANRDKRGPSKGDQTLHKVVELVGYGLNDRQVAESIGRSVTTAQKLRQRAGLPPNYRRAKPVTPPRPIDIAIAEAKGWKDRHGRHAVHTSRGKAI